MPPRLLIVTRSCSVPLTLAFIASFLLIDPASAQGTPPAKGGNGQPLKMPPTTGQIGKMYVAPPPGLEVFKKALAATEAGRFAEAERLYRQVVKDAPEAGAAWANLGLLVGRQGRVKEAIGYLTKATQVSPQTGAFWAQLSAYQLRGAQWKAAEQSARKALALNPQDMLALANLADALFPQQRYADALPALQKLRKQEGPSPTEHTEISLIMALSASGKHSEAVDMARKRTIRLPKNVYAFLLLGDTARRAGDIVLAESAYKQAATLDPKNEGAKAGLSVLAAMRGDRDVAMKLINERLKKEPKNAGLHFQKGYLLYTDERLPNEKRFPGAEVAFRSAALLDPRNAMYQTYTGIALMMQGPFPHLPKDQNPPDGAKGFDTAEHFLRNALSLSPRLTVARLAMASIAERRNKPDEAIAHYQAILSYSPRDRDAHRGLAGVYYASGKKADAYREMNAIADLYPKETQALSELASWYVADNLPERAQEAYDRILQRDPKDAPAHIALGRILEEKKRVTDAIAQYQAAFSVAPKNQDAALLLGSALLQMKRTEDAVNVYHQFLNAVPDNNPVRWQLAQTLRDNKRFDEALAEMQRLTLRQDDPNRTLYLLAAPRLLAEQKRFGESIQMLMALQQEHPKDDEIRYTLAEIYEQAGQKDKAESILTEISNRPPDPAKQSGPAAARSRILLAEMYERAEQWSAAAGQYEDVLRRDPMQTAALYGLSRVRDKEQKSDAALEFMEGLATFDPKEPSLPAVGGIHQLFINNRKLDQWREFTKRLLAKYPENRDAQYIRARSLTEEDKVETDRKEAIALFQKITSKNPKDVSAQRFLAKELEAAGQKDEAIAAYRAVLKIQATDADALAGLQRLGAK